MTAKRKQTERLKAGFLRHLAQTAGNVLRSCQASGLSRATALRHYENDPNFRAKWGKAALGELENDTKIKLENARTSGGVFPNSKKVTKSNISNISDDFNDIPTLENDTNSILEKPRTEHQEKPDLFNSETAANSNSELIAESQKTRSTEKTIESPVIVEDNADFDAEKKSQKPHFITASGDTKNSTKAYIPANDENVTKRNIPNASGGDFEDFLKLENDTNLRLEKIRLSSDSEMTQNARTALSIKKGNSAQSAHSIKKGNDKKTEHSEHSIKKETPPENSADDLIFNSLTSSLRNDAKAARPPAGIPAAALGYFQKILSESGASGD